MDDRETTRNLSLGLYKYIIRILYCAKNIIIDEKSIKQAESSASQVWTVLCISYVFELTFVQIVLSW